MIGLGLDWYRHFAKEVKSAKASFDPSYFIVSERKDGSRTVELRQPGTALDQKHRFQVSLKYDAGGDFNGEVSVEEGTILGPRNLGPSVPGGNGDPLTMVMQPNPQTPMVIPAVETLDASIGEKIWLECLWALTLEALGEDPASEKETDITFWSLYTGEFMAGPVLPIPEITDPTGAITCPLLIAEVVDDGGGGAKIVQRLHNDIALTFPFAVDWARSPAPVVPPEPPEEDPPVPIDVSISGPTTQAVTLVSGVTITGGSVDQVTESFTIQDYSITIGAIGSTDGSHIVDGAAGGSPVGEFVAC